MNIIEQSKRIHKKVTNFNPKSLLKLTKTLYKNTKNNNNKWLRVASLCEIIYQNMKNKNQTRKDFFNSSIKINENYVLQLEEFWKTDLIFKSSNEKQQFREDLKFYEK